MRRELEPHPSWCRRLPLFPRIPVGYKVQDRKSPTGKADMESTIFKFVLKYSLRDQIVLLVLTVASFPFFYLLLYLPKLIVNEAIDADASAFPVEVFDIELGQIEYLLALCMTFLGLVLVNGGFKYFLNVYRGVVGERMLRRLRYDLFVRMLRFPLPRFRRTSQGELVSTIVAETDPLGGYIGDSIALPAFQGGMLITLLIFMFIENPVLGVAAIALYPVQMWLIPKLQRKLNARKKERIRLARALSERIGEVVTGIREIHTHDTSRLERAEYSERVGEIYRVRVLIYRLKFFIKFANNFIAQITPFFFYSIGGYLVIQGDLTFGSLVAVIAAYEKLADPWKELLNFYQVQEDAKGKYELLLESFQVPGMLEQEQIDAEPETRTPVAGTLAATNLDLKEDDESETTFPGGLSLTTELPATVAIVGGAGCGSDRLAHIVAGLRRPGTGALVAGAVDLISSPEAVTGRQIAYVGPETSLFSGTLRDNLLYSLKHRPTGAAAYDESGLAQWERLRAEAARAGNSVHDIRADWIDYSGAGVEDAESMNARAIEVLSIVDMDDDIYQLGLQSSVDPAAAPELARGVLEARRTLRTRLADLRVAHLVDPFDRDAYNVNMTVAENLLFGTPRDRTFDPETLAANAYVRKVLTDVGLMDDFVDIGRQVARVMVDLFADVAPGSELFEQFSFISAEDLPEFRSLLARTESDRADDLQDDDRTMFLSLTFKLVPARHRLGFIDEPMQKRLVLARRRFSEGFGAGETPIEFFDAEHYNSSVSILDNILFGRLAYGRQRSAARISETIGEVVDTLGLRRAITECGLDYPVGIAGSRLSSVQRQKLALARAVLKRPDMLVLDRATAPLDASSQTRILDNLLKEFESRALIWVVHRASLAERFAQTIVLEGGKVVEQGTFADLNRPGTVLHEMALAG